MSRRLQILIGIVVVVIVGGVAVFVYATRPLAAPSQDIQDSAQQLDVDTESGGDAVVFRISQAESQAEFNIEEVLFGQDTTVVGTTNQVAGDIAVDFSNPGASQVGEIRINARTFETDRRQRDSAIGRFILQSENDAYEFITFVPTAINGLPDTIAVGDTINFEITGDLTVTGTTQSVTFTVEATLETADRLVGHAETVILYPDFDLSIPNVPSVTGVEDEVILKLDFVALRVTDPTAVGG